MGSFFVRLAVLTILAASVVSASTQSGSSLTGSVFDQNKDAIAGATVRVINIVSGRVVAAKTSSSGEYKIDGLQPGSYRISVSSNGFATVARSLTLTNSDRITRDFSLEPGTIEDHITVTAGKGNARVSVDTPHTVTVTSAAEIETRRPQSTLQAIEKTPNLSSIGSNPSAERPRLRGLSSNRLLMVIDGERLNNFRSDPLSGISPSVLDVTELESIEVVSGAGSSLYGSDALAGTINLVTKAPVRIDAAQLFGIRFDSDINSNGLFRRGALAMTWSIPKAAVRLRGSLFATGDYRSGDEAIDIQEVVRLGRFATEMGNVAGNNVARTYGVWQLPERADIENGSGHGFNDQVDVRLFPTVKQSVRYRQLNSQHKEIEFPFITPPFDGRDQSNGFRRLDKHALGYEGHELANRISHVSGSFYRQKYSFADDNFVSAIDEGSSWEIVPDPQAPAGALSILTGEPSRFTLGNFTDGKNSVTSYGLNLQATLIPWSGAAITTGGAYLRDFSRDEFSRTDFRPGTPEPPSSVTGRASNPDSVYRNAGWFNLLEYEPVRWLRLIGGFRIDNWKTEARVTPGFPLGTEAAILDVSLSNLIADPGQIEVDGLTGISALVNGTGRIRTNNTVATGNFGVVVRMPGRLNPYFRWANSYREPGITERYILRNFGDPTFSVLLISNTELKPERGNNYEAGLKVQRDRWTGSLAYFRNSLDDFLRPAFSNVLFVPADPSRGLDPLSPDFPFHGVLYVQRTNTARARIQGVEGSYELSIPLGREGSVAPFGSFGWLKGSDLNPDANASALIEQFYNRPDSPIPLRGSLSDAPLPGITPFRGLFGARYSSVSGRWLGQYQVRYESRVVRADPLDLSSTISTQYGTLASLKSFANHSLRLGYTYRRETRRVSFIFGVDNLTDHLYFEHFQNAPAPGRSFVFGVTTDFSNLLSR
jgi:outer membrane receptor protein involved in Fe transport